jgi:hypothetical protein
MFNIHKGKCNSFSSFEVIVHLQRQDFYLPTHVHNISRPISNKCEYNQCSFQGTQIHTLITYFFHHIECDGDMCDSLWFFSCYVRKGQLYVWNFTTLGDSMY